MSGEALIGVVEDNDLDFGAYQRAFSAFGRLQRWTSAEALIETVLGDARLLGSLDLLVLDLRLPGVLDGVHVAHTVRGAPGGADLPIVVLSGSGAERDIARAMDAGVTEYELKPQGVADLHALAGRLQTIVAAGRGS